MTSWKARLAPTPSGFLHEGNALNFLLVQHLQTRINAKIFLRIDDLDQDRVRDDYINDIFHTLDWLKIHPDEGPSSVEEFKQYFSQSHRYELYRQAFNELKKTNQLFACTCSRKLVGPENYPGTCRSVHVNFDLPHCWRFYGEGRCELGDFVVWTKNNQAAYQLASIVDDQAYLVNFVVRGEDLRQSSQAQMCLNELLYPDFKNVIYHHSLVTNGKEKLSKSQLQHQSLPLRQRYQSVDQLKERLGFEDHVKQLNLFLESDCFIQE